MPTQVKIEDIGNEANLAVPTMINSVTDRESGKKRKKKELNRTRSGSAQARNSGRTSQEPIEINAQILGN